MGLSTDALVEVRAQASLCSRLMAAVKGPGPTSARPRWASSHPGVLPRKAQHKPVIFSFMHVDCKCRYSFIFALSSSFHIDYMP